MVDLGKPARNTLRPLLAAAALFLAFSHRADAVQSVQMAWNADSDPSVAGYELSYGTTKGVTSSQINAGTNTSLIVSNLIEGQTNYFVVAAYNAQGVLGQPGGQVTYVVPGGTNTAQSGALELTLNVGGAQWAVDEGAWQASGTTMTGLSVGSHTVSFSDVTGYTTPANQDVSIVANQTEAYTATYVAIPQTGSLEATLNLASAQWAVDGGAWQQSGAVLTGLSAGSHTVSFSAVSGYTTPANQAVAIVAGQTASVSGSYALIPQTGSLAVTLNVSSAHWAVDGGAWQNSGAVVSGLPVGSHTVIFSVQTGYTTPANQTVSILANQTVSISGNYTQIPQTGAVQVTLTPTNAQWAVDNGAMQNSGAIVSGLSLGTHTISFGAVSGYTTPAAETISVTASQTTSISATYAPIPPSGSLTVTMNVAGSQWAVDGGALQSSGAVVAGLSVGSHTVSFSAVSGWTTPASEAVSIVANQTSSISGNYVAIPQTGAVEVTLSPTNAQWSVDNGVLQDSGAVVSDLSTGLHTISFGALSGYTTPSNQTVTVSANQTTTISANYASIPQTGGLTVTLNVAGAQWAVDAGAWQSSGATVTGLSTGNHTVIFSVESGYTTPANQTVSIVGNQTTTISANYVAIPQTGAVEVTVNPTNGQWTVDFGPLQDSGALVTGMSVGSHTISFSAVSGYTSPSNQIVSILANKTNSITAAYTLIPQTGALKVTLNVTGAQWAVDGGAWQSSGATVSGLPAGTHTVIFSAESGYTTPANQNVTIAVNQTTSISASYVAIPQTGGIAVTLTPTNAQWSVDNGALQNSGTTVSALSVGSHTISFSAVSGYTTPGNRTVSVVANQTTSIAASYVAIPQTGSLQVTLSLGNARWAVDGGGWQSSGTIDTGLIPGTHTVVFSAKNGYTTPANQTVTVVANQTTTLSVTYMPIPQVGALKVTLNVTGAQWAVDGGSWENSGQTVAGLSVGSHTVSFSTMSGWTTPANQTVSISANETTSISATYVAIPQTGALTVTLNVAGAQWEVDGGVLQSSGAIVTGLSLGSHTVSFSAVTGWTTPGSQTVSITANTTNSISATYVAIPQTGGVTVTLTPTNAQWAVDNGTFQDSGAVVSDLSIGSHTISFSAVNGYTTPSNQTVIVTANQTTSITETYTAIPQTGALEVTLNAPGAQWEVDGGVLQSSGAIVTGLSLGSHTVSFSAVTGWTTPGSQTASITANTTNSISATYVAIPQTGGVTVTLTPTNGQWGVDNGTFQDSGAVVSDLSIGSHTISFSTVNGYTTPGNQTVTVAANQTTSITETYTAIPQTGALEVTLNAPGAQWEVDGGVLRSSGAIVTGLSIGQHTVSFGAVTGWTPPANETASITANTTNSISGTYAAIPQTGALEVALNVAGAQWAVDNGTLQNSGAIVNGLSVGEHQLNFSAESGYTAPTNQTVSIAVNTTNSITANYVAIPQTGTLEVTLNVAGAQWAVDGGTWQASGASVTGLSIGAHTVIYSAVSGYTTPANQTAMIAANQTDSINGTYVAIPQTGALELTLNVAGAQWAVDNGALQESGAIVTGLSVGAHQLSFSAESGYTLPTNPTVSITFNTTNSVTANYAAIPQTGTLEVTLNVPGAQWAVDGGEWQSSGASVSGLSIGAHNVIFSVVSGYATPANQMVTIAANQTDSISASYTAIPQTGALEVTLSPTNAEWAVDGGSLQESGALVTGLSVGEHQLSFSSESGYTLPTNQTVAISFNTTNSITANYVAIPQTGSLEVTLNVPGAMWAVDGGAWQGSGTVISGLSVGSHTVIFSGVTGYTAPANQTVTIAANQTDAITASYAAIPQLGALEVTLTPTNAQWAVDGGALQDSGAVVSGLSVGEHQVTFSAESGYTAPSAQTVSITANATTSIAASYTLIPQAGALQVTLNVAGALWAVDGGAWQSSGATVTGLPSGSHTIIFSVESGYTTPANQTVSIVANETASIVATYIAIPQTGALAVTLTPTNAQWTVDNGALQDSGTVVAGLSVGEHQVSFSALSGYTAPAAQTVLISANSTNAITAAYTAIPQTGDLKVTLNVAGAQWTVDGGAWENSGALATGLTSGAHTVSFSAESGYTTPANQTVTIVANQTATITATYAALVQTGSVEVTLTPTNAQWAVDNGTLEDSGAIVSGLSVGLHTISFGELGGYVTPSNQTVTITVGQTATVTATYAEIPAPGALQVTTVPIAGQWAVDGGTWNNSGAIVTGLANGPHSVSFSPESGWNTPATETVSVLADTTNSITVQYRAIQPPGALQVILNVPGAQWAVDGGAWQGSGATVSGLAVGNHTVIFSAENGYITPANQSVTIQPNTTTSYYGNYNAIAASGAVEVSLNLTNAQWSVDYGSWQDSGTIVTGLSAGYHALSYSAEAGYSSPTNLAILVVAGTTHSVDSTYSAIQPPGSLQVTVNLPGAQWAVDGGAWQSSGATVPGLSAGTHTVLFSVESGYTAPANQTVTIVSDQTASITGTYVALPQTGAVEVTLNVTNAQWAVDFGSMQDSGATVTGLTVGQHTLSFSAESGYTLPTNQTISIAANATNSIAANYAAIPTTGALTVTMNVAGALWTVDEGPWQSSGALVTGLSPGPHIVNFIAENGYATPASVTISIDTDETASITATYVALPQTGAVQVTVTPTNGQWSVDSGPMQESGAVISGLSVGNHTISFGDITGYVTPTNEIISVVGNQTALIDADYQPVVQTGALEVTLNAPGAQWSVDSGVWQDSGAILMGLTPGAHTLNFGAVNGWTAPASETIDIADNETNAITANYAQTPTTGALEVTLNAPGGQWAVDGGAWQGSGGIVGGLAAGAHTVSFNATSGWTTPVAQTVTVAANQTTSISGNYVAIPQTGGLEVTLNVQNAQWTVDSGDWQTSGFIVSGLSVGAHTLNFSTINGYTTPTAQSVTVTANQTNALTVAYANDGPPNQPSGTVTTVPFSAAMAGTYNGLFYPDTAVSDSTSGMLSGLIVKTNGAYSGKVLIAGSSLAVSGTFDSTGHANQTIVRGPRSGGALTLGMAFAECDSMPTVVGTISGTNGGLWTAGLNGVMATASSQSSRDTLLFGSSDPAPAWSPPGFGYATVTNHNGTVTLVGALADARSFSRSIAVSACGVAPIYLRFGGSELAMGWITNLYGQSPGGNIAWVKAGSAASANYKEGFTNLVSVMGSVWTNALPEHAAVDLSDASLTVFGPGWSAALNYEVTVGTNNVVGASGNAPNGAVKGTVNPKTGLLQMTINCQDGKAARKAYGAVLQVPGEAGGYFLNATNTGAFEVNPGTW